MAMDMMAVQVCGVRMGQVVVEAQTRRAVMRLGMMEATVAAGSIAPSLANRRRMLAAAAAGAQKSTVVVEPAAAVMRLAGLERIIRAAAEQGGLAVGGAEAQALWLSATWILLVSLA